MEDKRKGDGHTESRKSERDYDTRCYFNVRSKADIDNRHCLLLEPMHTDVDFVTRPFDLDIIAQVKRDVTTFIPISGSLELFSSWSGTGHTEGQTDNLQRCLSERRPERRDYCFCGTSVVDVRKTQVQA